MVLFCFVLVKKWNLINGQWIGGNQSAFSYRSQTTVACLDDDIRQALSLSTFSLQGSEDRC